jgi:hypothetical protein
MPPNVLWIDLIGNGFNIRSTIPDSRSKYKEEEKEEGSAAAALNSGVVAQEKESGEQSEPKIIVSNYLAQQIQR